ncbi:MAG: TrmH family RNA methyltransferase [Bacteroidota bacterium]|nr:TrmH family RNA methyltransferase [Bacteroidota bacterium]
MKKLALHELNRVLPEEFKMTPKNKISLVADNIRSGHNVGSLFRIADCFALESVILGGYSVSPPHPEIHKTAIGATDTVHWQKESDLYAYLLNEKQNNKIIIGIEQTTKSILLPEFHISKQSTYLLIFGNEVSGISESILTLLDYAIEIPQYGTKHSLNVSVAAGIVVWHFINNMS